MKQVSTYFISKTAVRTVAACCALVLFSVFAFAQNPCNAHFSHQTDTTKANTVAFGSPGNPSGSQFQWSFGDGTSSTDGSMKHTYSKGGVYYVCLTVYNTAVP